jgi:hypothetical protein
VLKILGLVGALVVLADHSAANEKAACQTLSAPLASYVAQLEVMAGIIEAIHLRAALDQFDGKEQAALLTMAEAAEALLPRMKNYIVAGQEAAYQIQTCSR